MVWQLSVSRNGCWVVSMDGLLIHMAAEFDVSIFPFGSCRFYLLLFFFTPKAAK